MANYSIWATPGMPEWERDLWRDLIDTARTERVRVHVERPPGDWIPYGRVPIELVPPEDEGPLMASGFYQSREYGTWRKGRRKRLPPWWEPSP